MRKECKRGGTAHFSHHPGGTGLSTWHHRWHWPSSLGWCHVCQVPHCELTIFPFLCFILWNWFTNLAPSPLGTWGSGLHLLKERFIYIYYLDFSYKEDLPLLPMIYLFSHSFISTWAHRYLSYISSYSSMLLYLFCCSNFSCFGHKELFWLTPASLCISPSFLCVCVCMCAYLFTSGTTGCSRLILCFSYSSPRL